MRRVTIVRIVTSVCLGLSVVAGAAKLPVHDNFDIRSTDDKEAVTALRQRAAARGIESDAMTQVDREMQTARDRLASQIPGFLVLDSAETGGPEVVGVARGPVRLAAPSEAPPEHIARAFMERNSWLFGLSPDQAAALELDADYKNPAGNLSWVRLKQRIAGLDVFRGFATVAITPAGDIARLVGQLAPGVPADLIEPLPRMSASQAVAAAAATVDVSVAPDELVIATSSPEGDRVVFQRGPFSNGINTELIYFPLAKGAVELAWSMTLWGDTDSYLVIVSADDGLLLFRKNITEYDTYNYSVYPSDSPAPLSPGGDDPTAPTTGTVVARTVMAVESQATNGDPWLPAGLSDPDKVTDGNNVEAGLDIDGSDGVDAPVPASNPATNTFSYTYNPAPGSPPPGDNPTVADYRNGAVVNLFYWTNRYHDLTYDLGFTEHAFNFQNDNYGRGGVAGDRVSAQAQDSSGTDNANFSTPADGGRGRMQMYRWVSTSPNRDGDLDAEIIIHELTHGLSNRLHANATGLNTNMAGGMGEGWSDFYAQSLLSEPSDPLHGVYAMGGYSTVGLSSASYYYGIRGFPKAVMSHTGGPNNRPHNPLTFADIDQTQFSTDDGAYPRLVAGHISTTADQVHAAGEVWSSALWEARGLLIQRLGHTVGNQTMLQLVTDGMKLDPASPTFLQARDSIIAADCAASGGANEADIWDGFALRGMGYSAQVVNPGTGGGTARVIEAFDTPTSPIMGTPSVIGSGCVVNLIEGAPPNPGETVTITVPLTNQLCGTAMTGVSAQIVGGTFASYGTLGPGATVIQNLTYTIPEGTCGDLLQLEVEITTDAGVVSNYIPLQVGPSVIAETSYTNATTIDIPAGQPGTTSGPASPAPSVVVVSGITRPVVGVTVTLNQLNHTWLSDVDILLEAPNGQKIVVLSDAWNSSNDPPVVATLRFADDAASPPPPSGIPPASGTFQPVNYTSGDTWDPPAPAGPYDDPPLSGFAGIANPNGDWKLWIDDDAGSDSGQLIGGWTLGILTSEDVFCNSCSLLFADGFESNSTSMWSNTTP